MRYLKRKSYLELKKHLEKKEISLIVGPRQAGKTTLIFHLKEELEKKIFLPFILILMFLRINFIFPLKINSLKR